MGYEISQFDIPDRKLPATNVQSKAGKRKDLGEAKITHTIFGKPKVRIIRDQDKSQRAWLLRALAMTVLAAASWEWWVASQQTEPLEPPPLKETIRVSAPAFQPEYIPPAATAPSVRNRPAMPPQTIVNTPAPVQKSVPQPLKPAVQTPAKPVAASPPITSTLQPASPAATNTSKSQVGLQPPPKLSAPIQPTVPVAPRITLPVAHPAASSPVAVAPYAVPPVEEDTSTLSPAVDKLLPDPVKEQP